MPSHKCRVCGDVLSRSTKLTEHMRSHTGEKPFQCTICSAKFSRSYDLTKHKELHSGSQRYKCQGRRDGVIWGCGKGFHKNGDLNRHLRRNNAEQCHRKLSEEPSLTDHSTEAMPLNMMAKFQSLYVTPIVVRSLDALETSHVTAGDLPTMMGAQRAEPHSRRRMAGPGSTQKFDDTRRPVCLPRSIGTFPDLDTLAEAAEVAFLDLPWTGSLQLRQATDKQITTPAPKSPSATLLAYHNGLYRIHANYRMSHR